MGKHSDIGIFTQRSEITVNYKDPIDLENAIKAKIKNLLNASVIETVPLDAALGRLDQEETLRKLDETLGILGEDEDE